jgi:hypothetical protein
MKYFFKLYLELFEYGTKMLNKLKNIRISFDCEKWPEEGFIESSNQIKPLRSIF